MKRQRDVQPGLDDANRPRRPQETGDVDLRALAPKTASRSFVHTELVNAGQQIRLLRFLRGETRSSISCELRTFDFTDAPSYVAISYVWGPPFACRTIKVDGKTFSVRANCHFALQQVAHQLRHEELLFWIDSVCIDQGKLPEKGLQVNMMGEIFARARNVYSCIGHHEGDSEMLIRVLQRFGEEARLVSASPSEDAAWNGFQEIMRKEHNIMSGRGETMTEFCLRFCRAWEAFGNRNYWTRLWIVQEVLLAKEVCILCQFDAIPASTMNYCMQYFPTGQLTKQLRKGGESLPMRWIGWHMAMTLKPDLLWNSLDGSFPIPFEQVFELFGDRKRLDDRDGIYALLRITAWPRGMEPPRPDYNITGVELFLDILRRLRLAEAQPGDFDRVATLGIRQSLNLDIQNEGVQEFLCRRTRQRNGSNEQGPSDHETCQIEHRPSWDMRNLAFRLTTSRHGGLTMTCPYNVWNWTPGKSHFENEERTGHALYLDDMKLLGYVCNAARTGDWVLRVRFLQALWIVIRGPDLDRKFQMIGYASLRAEFLTCCAVDITAPDYDFFDNLLGRAVLDLNVALDLEDYLTFLIYSECQWSPRYFRVAEKLLAGSFMTDRLTRFTWSSYAQLKSPCMETVALESSSSRAPTRLYRTSTTHTRLACSKPHRSKRDSNSVRKENTKRRATRNHVDDGRLR